MYVCVYVCMYVCVCACVCPIRWSLHVIYQVSICLININRVIRVSGRNIVSVVTLLSMKL